MHSTMHLYPIDGAAARVGKNETAWNNRDAKWTEVIVGVDPDPANNEKIISWTKRYYDALHPYAAGGAYVNFLMGDEGEERVKKLTAITTTGWSRSKRNTIPIISSA